jgi:hypothetical protein
MWLGMTKSKIYGPILFNEATVTGSAYLDMLEQFLQDGILNTAVFQQDGAACHYAGTVQTYLNDVFPNQWTGRGGNRPWAQRSPDLTPLDFFCLGLH